MARTWHSPRGPIELARGDGGDRDLQAWDGADAYLLEAASESAGPVLVVDDRFGALAVGLGARCAAVWADHEPSRAALVANARRNGLVPPPFVPFTSPPPVAPVVLARLPRSGRRLAWICARLAALPVGATVLFGARSKDVQRSAVAAVDAAIGPASTGRAAHRARLVTAVRDDRVPPAVPERTWRAEGVVVRGHPGVFGAAQRAPGAAALLAVVRDWGAGSIVDLGCGGGILGAVAGLRNPDATVSFRDASHLAVASARRTWEGAAGGDRATFTAADLLDGVASDSTDVVLCNPPFHAGRTITRVIAHRMIAESARVLRPGGRLLLVGNRHLGYHLRLPKHFGAVDVVRAEPRFVVFEARGPR